MYHTNRDVSPVYGPRRCRVDRHRGASRLFRAGIGFRDGLFLADSAQHRSAQDGPQPQRPGDPEVAVGAGIFAGHYSDRQ